MTRPLWLARAAAVAVGVWSAVPAGADCGFCAREVTLSLPLVACYLERFDEELAQAASEQAEIHLVELAACGVARGGRPMPQPRIAMEENVPEVDEAFLNTVSAMTCLAEDLRKVTFASEKDIVVVEVRDDC